MSESLRIIFAGTPDFAARHLDALLSSDHNVVGVFTQPDRPAGRGKKLMPSPVKVLAEEKGLPVFQPVSLRPQENQQLVADLQAEVAETQKKLGDLLRFLQEAFGKGTELSMAVNDLTVAPVATAFLGQFLSTDYFAASRDLLLHQIDLTGLV